MQSSPNKTEIYNQVIDAFLDTLFLALENDKIDTQLFTLFFINNNREYHQDQKYMVPFFQ